MSRIGKKPVVLPKGVTAKIENEKLAVRGPKGELKLILDASRYPGVETRITDGAIAVTRKDDGRRARTEQGLVRALIQNMVVGVTTGYSRILDVVGVGYRAELKGKALNLSLGFSHPIEFALPDGIAVMVDKQTRITIQGIDKKLVGETAACIRRYRPPEPYKGKGVRYSDEVVKRKVGKAAAGTTGG
ncbi:MAG: 50S ribosomal protein L6 [Pseudomonadota bacterium]